MFGHSFWRAAFVGCAHEQHHASADRSRTPVRRHDTAVAAAAPGPAAAVVFPGQRGVPLPRPGVCSAAVRPPRRARGGVAADRGRGGAVRGVAPPVAAARRHGPARARAARPAWGRAGRDERAVLPRGGAAAAGNRGCHRVSRGGAFGTGAMSGIDQLGAAMLVAAVVVTPVGFDSARAAFAHPVLLLAGVGVGLCSSVIPYVTDQLAMARLPRATFALMLALLPMVATIIGAIVLRQLPTGQDLLGIALVVAGVALHQVPAHERLHRHATV